MSVYKRFIKIADGCSVFGASISCIFMILIVLLILVEIFLRTFFNTSTLIADEYSAYFFVVVVMLGLGYTFKENGHIRITLIISRMPPGLRKLFELVAVLIVFVLVVFMLYHSVLMVYETYKLDMRADSIAETPLWIPQIALIIGFFIFALALLAHLIRILKGDA